MFSSLIRARYLSGLISTILILSVTTGAYGTVDPYTPAPPSGYPAGGLFMKYWENLTRTRCPSGQAVVGFQSGGTSLFSTPICAIISGGSSLSGTTITQFGSGMTGTLNYLAKYTPDGSHIGNSAVYESGGLVGIGTQTPERKLHVSINNAGEGGGRNLAMLVENTANATGSNAAIQIKTSTLSARSAIDFSTASRQYGAVFGYHHQLGQYQFWTSNNDKSEWSPKVFINKLGNVGIGPMQDPQAKLYIISNEGEVNTASLHKGRLPVIIEGNEKNGDGVNRAGIQLKDVSTGALGALWNIHIVGTAMGPTSNYDPGSFAINRGTGYKGQTNSGGFTISPETMYVGIGVAKPKQKLDVSGDALINDITVGRGGGSVSSNTAVGSGALRANASGFGNVAIGISALISNTSGSINVANGMYSLRDNTIGYGNVAIGRFTLMNNASGFNNVAVGNDALSKNTTSHGNVGIGAGSLKSNTVGYGNVANGYFALSGNTIGNNNVAIGHSAGDKLMSGNNNIFIGTYANASISNTGSNQLNIGNWIYGNSGSIGIGVQNPGEKLDINGKARAVSFLNQSDIRLKDNISPLTSSLEKIMKLNGYSFSWKEDGKRDIGVIAQEVEKVFPEIVHSSGSGGYKSVEYGNLIAPVIESIKELAHKQHSQDEKVEKLLKIVEQQQKEIDVLKAQIEKR